MNYESASPEAVIQQVPRSHPGVEVKTMALMTVHQVAELLNVHENYIYDLAGSGELPSFKIGGMRRFRPDEVNEWLDAHRSPSIKGCGSGRKQAW